MRQNVIILLALVTLNLAAVPRARAGSAVAMEHLHGNLWTAYGGPFEREKERALEFARLKVSPPRMPTLLEA